MRQLPTSHKSASSPPSAVDSAASVLLVRTAGHSAFAFTLILVGSNTTRDDMLSGNPRGPHEWEGTCTLHCVGCLADAPVPIYISQPEAQKEVLAVYRISLSPSLLPSFVRTLHSLSPTPTTPLAVKEEKQKANTLLQSHRTPVTSRP